MTTELPALYGSLAEDCRTTIRQMFEGLVAGRKLGLATAAVERHLALDPIEDPEMAMAVNRLVNQEPIVDDPEFIDLLGKLEGCSVGSLRSKTWSWPPQDNA